MDDITHGAALSKSRRALNKPGSLERVPVKINRNLMNFPLARDARAKAEWFQGRDTGGWMADLPGEGRKTHRIRLILPANIRPYVRRCPNALDMNVLLQLLAEAQRPDGTKQIEFASFAVLLRRLGLPVRNRERARVVSSLEYLNLLSIRWSHWYPDPTGTGRTLAPPIEDANRDGNRIMISLHRDWCELARTKGYYVWLPLPLPSQAAVQNLVLLILTQDSAHEVLEPALIDLGIYFDQMAPLTKPMDRWWLTRKLGLRHKQRNSVLVRAVDQAAEWFAVHGGKLKLVTDSADDEDTPSGRIAFRYAKPRVPRRKSSMGRGHGPPQSLRRKSARRWDAAISNQGEALTPDEAEWFELIGREAARRNSGGRN